jgi:glycosyltransferase involved in cell wall biosynthesis
MARKIAVLVPGPLDTRTGGYEYDRRVIEGLRASGWQVDARELREGFPHPSAEARREAARLLASLAGDTLVLIDGLAFGAMPVEACRESARLKLLALVHMPLAEAIGLDRRMAAELEAGERAALSAARFVIATGNSSADLLSRYGVERGRIAVIEPGTDPAALSRGSDGTRVELLSVGSVTEGKGTELLVAALAMIPERNWHLTCAGSLDRDPAAVARVKAIVRRERLDDRVALVGELDAAALRARYDEADVFVLATLRETYCMAVAEALARGLPVVSTQTGAIPELVRPGANGTPAGLITPPGDVKAMARELSRVCGDSALRATLARGARQARTRLPRWETAIARLNDVLERVGGSNA